MTPEEIEAARLEAERLEAERLRTEPSDTEKLFLQTMQENERGRREAEQRSRQLEDELTQLRNSRRIEIPVGEKKLTKEEFWEDPVTAMTKMIADQVAPLRQTAAQIEAQSAYTQLKNQYRAQIPAFAAIESAVDQLMQGAEPTHNNMAIAIERAIGRAVAGNPDFFRPKSEVPTKEEKKEEKLPTSNESKLPPHLRPSHTPPAGDKTSKRRALTELEHRVRKEYGLTEDQYLDSLEGNADVGSWKKKGAQ